MKTIENKQTSAFKKISAVLLIIAATIFASCEGPSGPMGLPGEDGLSYYGTSFDVEVDFTPENEYSVVVNHPSGLEVLTGDIVLVYILWEVDGAEIWRLCPQTIVLPEGVIQYNFDYTEADTRLFMEYTVDELYPEETQNQWFRIAILPIDYISQKSVDINDFNSLLQTPELQLNMLDKVDLNTIENIK